MKEDWLNDIHDRMADYEADEPQGLWDDLCRARAQEELRRKSRLAFRTWTSRITAAAAVVLIAFGFGWLVNDTEEELPVTADVHPLEQPVSESHDLAVQEYKPGELVAELKPVEVSGPVERNGRKPKHGKQVSENEVERSSSVPVYTKEPEADPVKEAGREEPAADTHLPGQKSTDKALRKKSLDYHSDYIAHADTRKARRLSFGVFTTGGTGATLHRSFTDGNMVAGLGPDASDWEDSPKLGILLYNQGQEIQTEIKHRLPVTTGVSVAYKINRWFGIGSGVTYTNLTSDIREGSANHYFTGEQTLHYIGIPLNLKFTLFSWKGFELYASTGCLGEKCVSGNVKKKYVLENQVKRTENESVVVDPLQWSVNLSAGVQYNFISLIGIYVEPGLSYYFNDGSPVKTIYKDKPLNFNLNLGLRFTFGSK